MASSLASVVLSARGDVVASSSEADASHWPIVIGAVEGIPFPPIASSGVARDTGRGRAICGSWVSTRRGESRSNGDGSRCAVGLSAPSGASVHEKAESDRGGAFPGIAAR